MTERLLTAAELGERLALSTATVLDWFEAGRLPGFKLGRVVRFREEEVLEWVEAQRVGPSVAGSNRPLGVARSVRVDYGHTPSEFVAKMREASGPAP